MVSDVMNMVMSQFQTPEKPAAESVQTGDSYRDRLKKLMDADKPKQDAPDAPQKETGIKAGETEDAADKADNSVQKGINPGFSLFFAQNIQSDPIVLTQPQVLQQGVGQINEKKNGQPDGEIIAQTGDKPAEQPFAATTVQEPSEVVADSRTETEKQPAGMDTLFSMPNDEKVPEETAEMPKVQTAAKPDAGAAKQTAEENILPVQQNHQTSEKVSDKQEADKQEAATSAGLNTMDVLQPMRENTEPVGHVLKSGTSQELPESIQNLPKEILGRISAGEKEFTVQLQPENLGKLTIKASYEEGRATVSIICTDSKTMEMLSGHAKEIGAILESNLGTPTNIVLDKTEPNYLEQENGQSGQDARNQPSDQDEDKKKKKDQDEGLDFLHQLRLGLV